MQTTDTTSSPKRSKLETLLGDMFPVNTSEQTHTLNIRELVTAEMNVYLEQPSVGLNTDPLQWWKANADKFELIAELANQTLIVQGTSVPSERVFSTCGEVVSSRRSRLTGDHVSQIIFLNKNHSLVKFD